MEVRADIQGVRPVALVDAALPTARVGDLREETTGRLAQIVVGQRVEASVTSLLSDGSFLVNVADTAVRTNLPPGSKVGDQLQLTLLATEPRPTFRLDGEGGAAPTKLSTAGKLIDTLLSSNSGSALIGKTALVSSPATAPAQLAEVLQHTLASSGLFYESHLQQWNAGERPLAEVLREPQNQHLASASGSIGAETAAAPQSASVDGTLSTATNLLDAKGAAATISSSTDPDTLKTVQVLHPETAQLVHLQLNTLDQPRVQWRGEVWPGQQMEWEVREDDQPAQRTAKGDEERSWQSVVRFDLPTLGKVAATITLVGDHVQVQVRAANSHTADTLRSFSSRLSQALDAAGTRLDSLHVKQDEQA